MTVRYFEKKHLIEAYRRGGEWGLNRRLDPGVLGYPDASYPVSYEMKHERAGKLHVEPHVRCVVWVPFRLERPSDMVLDLKDDDSLLVVLEARNESLHLIVDVPQIFYDSLPTKEVEWDPAMAAAQAQEMAEDEDNWEEGSGEDSEDY